MEKKDTDIPIIHVETGSELRKFSNGTSYTAQLTKETINNGGLMPEFMMVYVWGKIFAEQFTGKESLIFDGTPRKMAELQVLSTVFDFYKLDKPWVIYLDVHHEELFKRLTLRGRNDDTHEGITNRLTWYQSEVLPCVEALKADSRYNFVEEVHADIVKRVGLE